MTAAALAGEASIAVTNDKRLRAEIETADVDLLAMSADDLATHLWTLVPDDVNEVITGAEAVVANRACTSVGSGGSLGLRTGGGVANRHFAKLADVWKHLPLVEVLSIERPTRYWESHAGSATYEMVDDAERRYGVLRFLQVAPHHPALARSRYLAHLSDMRASEGTLTSYPGSPMLAALELGSACTYLLCDLDPASVTNLGDAARQLGLGSRVRVVDSDGMTALRRARVASGAGGSTLVHIDPYDPRAVGPGGLSAVDLARELISEQVGVVYWYGYDQPERRRWAFRELAAAAPRAVWCGDMMVTALGTDPGRGDLGVATTDGTGFGVVCANVSSRAVDACQRLGAELAAAYDAVPLPDGRLGGLDFTTQRSG